MKSYPAALIIFQFVEDDGRMELASKRVVLEVAGMQLKVASVHMQTILGLCILCSL